jgi:colicin import membrane protein
MTQGGGLRFQCPCRGCEGALVIWETLRNHSDPVAHQARKARKAAAERARVARRQAAALNPREHAAGRDAEMAGQEVALEMQAALEMAGQEAALEMQVDAAAVEMQGQEAALEMQVDAAGQEDGQEAAALEEREVDPPVDAAELAQREAAVAQREAAVAEMARQAAAYFEEQNAQLAAQRQEIAAERARLEREALANAAAAAAPGGLNNEQLGLNHVRNVSPRLRILLRGVQRRL